MTQEQINNLNMGYFIVAGFIGIMIALLIIAFYLMHLAGDLPMRRTKKKLSNVDSSP